MTRRPRVHDADVEALERHLRALLATGEVSADEVARYEADRERLLDLIGDQMREQREYDDAMRRLRVEMETAAAADGRDTGGDGAAHRAHLDERGLVDTDPERQAEFGRVEAMVNAPYRDTITDLDDRDRARDEAPAAPIGGTWFTPDDTTEDGVRPLTEDELRRIGDLVRATQAEAVAGRIADDDAPPARYGHTDDGTEWTR